IARAKRYKSPLSMMLLDIDHFKNINDTYGHLIGDQVLKSLGELIFKKVRDTDIVARYGGEEIAILALETSLPAVLDLAERLRVAVEAATMVPADASAGINHAIKITVSIGVTDLDEQVIDSQSLIERADEALYEAKRTGRNKVVAHNSMPLQEV
ncbi:MAG: GGDEF domain-containing protein, partial [Syntrophales bacterium LBB04]|nr:GGDEF domain-containing protein [Syntrophales bacterium LBB04]